MTIMERAHRLQSDGVFLGGPLSLFETAGRKTLMTLLNEGLTPQSKVLDIGCGCLRIGYWLIHFLDEDCYYGIEPNLDMFEAGFSGILEPGLADKKRPRFSHNAHFNFSVFDSEFDFFVARSIWTHASKEQIRTMLDGFVRYGSPHAIFLTSKVRTKLLKRDYKGTSWIGRSHESDTPGIVAHSFSWIRTECENRALIAEELRDETTNFGKQIWTRIRHQELLRPEG